MLLIFFKCRFWFHILHFWLHVFGHEENFPTAQNVGGGIALYAPSPLSQGIYMHAVVINLELDIYTWCFIKRTLFVFFIIYSNYEQFTKKLLPVVAEEILIRNI